MDSNCFYCTKDQRLHDLMIEVCELSASTLYLFKEQTYKGRCIVAFKGHKRELFEMNEKELELYTRDVARAAKAIKKAFEADKINYAAYGDRVSHFHMHLVPKYEGGPKWGEVFELTPVEKIYLSDEGYESMIRLLKVYL